MISADCSARDSLGLAVQVRLFLAPRVLRVAHAVAVGAADSGSTVFTGVVALIVGALAFAAASAGVMQKWRADRREHWWARTQWAFDKLADDEESRTIGLLVLVRQATSRLADEEDWKMLEDIADLALDEADEGTEDRA
jgi:hypothetical protein